MRRVGISQDNYRQEAMEYLTQVTLAHPSIVCYVATRPFVHADNGLDVWRTHVMKMISRPDSHSAEEIPMLGKTETFIH